MEQALVRDCLYDLSMDHATEGAVCNLVRRLHKGEGYKIPMRALFLGSPKMHVIMKGAWSGGGGEISIKTCVH